MISILDEQHPAGEIDYADVGRLAPRPQAGNCAQFTVLSMRLSQNA